MFCTPPDAEGGRPRRVLTVPLCSDSGPQDTSAPVSSECCAHALPVDWGHRLRTPGTRPVLCPGATNTDQLDCSVRRRNTSVACGRPPVDSRAQLSAQENIPIITAPSAEDPGKEPGPRPETQRVPHRDQEESVSVLRL
ncbi:hypothetical protein NDU88_000297 [Pleurodeles waltl]|uniref:Uncharacterized protein n=1 Tax=Pleurodeles waltl TaxID=8319 RepID=A0AAV7Q0C0_PLEWA|nr:hypothetical protein NDU88_000297 [Pleurodeles waltl]